MHIKKFEAPTLQEALENVKRELGPEAIILQTKKYKRGFGLMSKASVEITAAVSDRSLLKKAVTERKLGNGGMERIRKLSATQQAEIQDRVHEDVMEGHLERALGAGSKDQVSIGKGARPKADQSASSLVGGKTRQAVESRTAQTTEYSAAMMSALAAKAAAKSAPVQAPILAAQQASGTNPSRPLTERRYIDIEDDESEQQAPSVAVSARASSSPATATLKGSPGQLSGGVPASGKFEASRSVNEEVEQLKRLVLELKSAQEDKQDSILGLGDRQALGREHGLTSPVLQEGFELLMLNGIEKRYAVQLLRKAAFELGGKVADAEQVLDQMAVEILQSVKVQEFPFKRSTNGVPEVVCVVGPTGVGKTTTVAKIASLALQKQKDGTVLKVGLINLDSYKVAANDQLATYARVLNVPFRAASNAEELRAAMMDFENLDLVILDTAGRSHRDPQALVEMEKLIHSIPNVRTQLVVSATTRDAGLADTASRFSIFKPEGMSVSKLDEATTYGGLYNLAMRSRLPYIFFATGQRVPEDIEAATPERVAALVLDLEV